MADRKGMYIVTGVVALGAAALAVVFLWWMPRQDRAEARAQIESWEKRWKATRGCLLGEPTLSADPGEALALRELSSGVVHTDTSCTEGVQHLMRGQGAASPIEAVEDKWRAVEAAIPALGEAYVMWISSDHDERDAWLDKLGVAISSLDAAQDELRRTAGMAAIERKGSVAVTRLEAPASVVAGDHALRTDARIQAGVISAQEFDGNSTIDLVVTGPAMGLVLTHPTDVAFSLPDASWAASGAAAAVEGGPVTVVAGPVREGVFEAAEATAIAPTLGHEVALIALGSGAERSVLLEASPSEASPFPPIALARSTDTGKTWTVETLSPTIGTVDELGLDVAHGLVDATLNEVDGYAIVRLDAAHPLDTPRIVEVGVPFRFADACRRDASLWWTTDDDRVTFVDGATMAKIGPIQGDRVLDCTATAALVETGGTPVIYSRCDRTGCKEALRGSAYSFGRAAMLDDGRVVYAASRGRIIALWTEDVADPKYYKLPEPRLLHAVVVWGGVPYALLTDPAGDDPTALVSAPLR